MAKQLKINWQYPENPNYTYETRLRRLNLDEEKDNSILAGKGFIVRGTQSTFKKESKSIDGIFSSRFGRTLQDVNPFSDKYKCTCGYLTSRLNQDIICPICKTPVKFVDDDFEYFAWLVLFKYSIIHPNLYQSLREFLKTSRKDHLEDIIKPIDQKDIDGHTERSEPDPNMPYRGIGLIGFYEKFDEIMEYYLKRNPGKRKYYDDIMQNRDKVFTQSIPVFTLHLRPYRIEGTRLKIEGTNTLYTMMTKLVEAINKDDLKIFRKRKSKNQLLYDLNYKYLKLYDEIIKIISKKKGNLRSVFGGRYNFTSRNVIIPNPKLRIDEVIMPYKAMVELLQQSIINVLQKSYNISYADAYNIWSKAQTTKDERVYNIIINLIKDKPRGIPILINRNPTIREQV